MNRLVDPGSPTTNHERNLKEREEEKMEEPSPPPRCTACRGVKARARCRVCGTPYCDAVCQRRGWKVHKSLCSEDRAAVRVEHAVEREVAFALKKQGEAPGNMYCYLCLEAGERIWCQGCGCRGAWRFVHPDCLEKEEKKKEALRELLERYERCGRCRGTLTGALPLEMTRRLWRKALADDKKLLSLKLAAHLGSREFDASEDLHIFATKDLDDNDPVKLMSVVDRAVNRTQINKTSEALDMLSETLPKVKTYCDPADAQKARAILVNLLTDLGRRPDTLSLAQRACSMLVTLAGPDSETAHSAQWTYAAALAQHDRQRDAKNLLRNILPAIEKVHGTHHLLTQKARSLLQHLDSPPPSQEDNNILQGD